MQMMVSPPSSQSPAAEPLSPGTLSHSNNNSPEDENNTRAVHVIHTSALRHNYHCVVQAAAQQECQVMCVIKADGYGHGAVATAQLLADAHAFGVATLEEAIVIRKVRPKARILVLGAPVGVPQCLNEYCHYGIEVMISGPEVAKALKVWIGNARERKKTAVERMATESKEEALRSGSTFRQETTVPPPVPESAPLKKRGQSSTLGNVSGQDLAREVRMILMNQKKATEAQEAERLSFTETTVRFSNSTISDLLEPPSPPLHNKKLLWNALVDSGMGRLGFKTDAATVDILQNLVHAEATNAPIQFCGMCTHMAEAMNSSYTTAQIERFTHLLSLVRDAGIQIPTISTDNSAALLNAELDHFQPRVLLQPGSGTKGYCRIGGALYGQRPAFSQLRPASTLTASVRHVATLHAHESVGYDRAYVATRTVRIATLAIGFADGYPRDLGNGQGQVVIRNKIHQVVGNVCMDMLMVEVEEDDHVAVGDIATLWGPNEKGEHLVKLADIAEKLKTTQSALTCGLDNVRVIRKYV